MRGGGDGKGELHDSANQSPEVQSFDVTVKAYRGVWGVLQVSPQGLLMAF